MAPVDPPGVVHDRKDRPVLDIRPAWLDEPWDNGVTDHCRQHSQWAALKRHADSDAAPRAEADAVMVSLQCGMCASTADAMARFDELCGINSASAMRRAAHAPMVESASARRQVLIRPGWRSDFRDTKSGGRRRHPSASGDRDGPSLADHRTRDPIMPVFTCRPQALDAHSTSAEGSG